MDGLTGNNVRTDLIDREQDDRIRNNMRTTGSEGMHGRTDREQRMDGLTGNNVRTDLIDREQCRGGINSRPKGTAEGA